MSMSAFMSRPHRLEINRRSECKAMALTWFGEITKSPENVCFASPGDQKIMNGL